MDSDAFFYLSNYGSDPDAFRDQTGDVKERGWCAQMKHKVREALGNGEDCG